MATYRLRMIVMFMPEVHSIRNSTETKGVLLVMELYIYALGWESLAFSYEPAGQEKSLPIARQTI